MNVAVTGANGFIGKNLIAHLNFMEGIEVLSITRDDNEESLSKKLLKADFVFHLAGSNRPKNESEFVEVNVEFSSKIISILGMANKQIPVLYTSSTQAQLDNPYGKSKKKGEEQFETLSEKFNIPVVCYRLPGVFGKWCKPNYNSVVATFCYNVAHDLPLQINNADTEISVVYIDDVVKSFVSELDVHHEGFTFHQVEEVHNISLGALADTLNSFRKQRTTLKLPDLSSPLIKYLYSTYLTYLKKDDFAYYLQERYDDRGKLFEVLKSDSSGQIFMSTTKPGIVRGNHFHHTKTEKFCVIKGEARIDFRMINGEEILSYNVSGDKVQVVDIPPGYTHNIENIGKEDMIVLFWANEIFNPDLPDTIFLKV